MPHFLVTFPDTYILQIIGWSMWFSDYIFLDRSWAKDETTLKVSFFIRLLCSVLNLSTKCVSYIYLTKFCASVRFPKTCWFPYAILVGPFCRGNSLYKSKAFSRSRVCFLERVAYSQECFDSSYQGCSSQLNFSRKAIELILHCLHAILAQLGSIWHVNCSIWKFFYSLLPTYMYMYINTTRSNSNFNRELIETC